ncbi:helix-turn-helix domain-containing protein [Streptosporangium sp. NPDC023963]|uniref:winged helix-turn-helix transcriptional regulator n=1 Tax=Streptosporangium sp. NPDC023963 TaxID=3155608 RepID=UPI00341A9920
MEEGTSKSPSRCSDTGDAYVDAHQWDTREDCEVRQILDRVADKWSLLVIALLDSRTLRFTELSREIDGVSQRMLTVTLRHLERDGLVRRTVHPVVPPRVDYELTPLGVTLHDTIQSLVDWTERHQNEIATARASYDARADTAPVATGPAPSAKTGRGTARAAAGPGAATREDGVRAVGRGAVVERGGAVGRGAVVERGGAVGRGAAAVRGGAAGRAGVAVRGDGTPPATPLRNETPSATAPRDETRPSVPLRNETRVVEPAREESRPGAGLSRCEVCGDPIRAARTGRPARFCGTACRQRAHRRRSRAALRHSG